MTKVNCTHNNNFTQTLFLEHKFYILSTKVTLDRIKQQPLVKVKLSKNSGLLKLLVKNALKNCNMKMIK